MKTNLCVLIFKFLIVILLLSCNNRNKNTDTNCESICIDITKTNDNNLSEIFSKIKIIPLQTNDTVLLNRIKSVNYYDNKYYVIIDKTLIVHIFDSNGRFISNSAKKIGVGPEEYYTVNDAIYNQFTDKFDLLCYDNSEIISYDKNFKFIKRVKVKTKEQFYFSNFTALNKYEYALTPSMNESTDKVVVFNTIENKTKTMSVEGNIAKLTMTEAPFKLCSTSKSIYFCPISINYSVFKINITNKQLEKIINLKISKNMIEEKKLKNFKTDRETSDFLLNNSSYVLPLRNMVNDKFLVSIIIKENDLYTFTHNRQTGKNNIIKNKYESEKRLPIFDILEDNALYSLVNSFDINEYVDKNLLAETDKKLLENVNAESNPVILKYYIKESSASKNDVK